MKRLWAVAILVAVAGGLVVSLTTAQPRGRFQHPLMATFDTDRDGTISAKEIEGASAALKKLDRNSDGNLAREEVFRAGGRPPRGPGSRRPMPSRPIDLSSTAVGKDEAEKKILAVLKEMDDERRGMMNAPIDDGRLLRLLAETIGAKHVVEIGTSNGYSAIWQCLALRTTGGKLTTFEIDEHRAELARKNFRRAGVDQLVTLVFGNAHKTVSQIKKPIDMLFLDADKEGYIDYLQKLLPKVRPGGLIVAHNMNQRQAAPRFVKAITTNPKLETLFLHMQGAGVSVTIKKR